MNKIQCFSCGGLFPQIEGPTHRYMDSFPGCWACFGKVLAREYSDDQYWKMHRLTVDAYAVQHPGQLSPQAIQSVAVHLISICAVLEKEMDIQLTTDLLNEAASEKGKYQWLDLPTSMGELTVFDVYQAKNAEEHAQLVLDWAQTAWNAWSDHHDTIKLWLSEQLTIS